ncbi:hypothetical protein FDH86_gp099 [Arthrobacter phage Tank]|uniref:Uncharacterized protein n=1 Tax=Arthrobacter phage Tank TaxID=1772319 RepID=A0A0U4IPP7_9CAUD|nr:hypothetical protein FDH86_gp099 [Arthrobacter phage Tank]ALY10634.1 hypothetical protein TANK_99 [Arthrobacter phage Tank]
MSTRKARLDAERRFQSFMIVNDLYQMTPWYLLAERSILKAKMRSLAPVMVGRA